MSDARLETTSGATPVAVRTSAASDRIATSMRSSHQLLIGDGWCDAISGATTTVIEPATGFVLGTVAAADERDVDKAVHSGLAAQPDWKRKSPRERSRYLERIADRLESEADRLALIEAANSGNPVRAMRRDIGNAVEYLRYMAGIATEVKGDTIPVGGQVFDYTLREPFGLVGRITAFNHPLMFAAEKMAPPLLAGNAVVLKPSSLAPLGPLEFFRAIDGILPPGVLNVLTGKGETCGRAIVRHPRIKRIALTGSLETGRRVALDAAESGIKVLTLELGGKNPFIVLPDVDVARAADAAATGMNLDWTLGQSCGSTSRVLVHASIHDEFVGRVRERFDAFRVGLPTDEATDVGCLVSRAQLEKVERYVAIGQSEGARLVTGGSRPDAPELADGFFYRPTLFDRVDHTMRIAREEIFGPVLSILPWSIEAELIEWVNDTEYGLTANIWTDDLRTAHRLAHEVEAGYVWINGDGRHLMGAPFGGYKASGIGAEDSLEELLSFTELKNVSLFL